MRRLAIAAGWVAIGVAAFAIGRATAPAAVGPDLDIADPVVPLVARPNPLRSDDALGECQRRLALAEGVLRAKEHAMVGDPVPFPEDLPRQYRPDGFEDAVRGAMRVCPDTGLHLARVECSEYPCMAFFTQPEGSWNHAIEGLRACDVWKDQFGERGGQANASFMTDEGVVEFSMASVNPYDPGETPDENAGTRWTNRLEEGKQALMAELGGRDFTPLEEVDQQIEFWRKVGDASFLPDLEARRQKLLAEQNAEN